MFRLQKGYCNRWFNVGAMSRMKSVAVILSLLSSSVLFASSSQGQLLLFYLVSSILNASALAGAN